MSAPSDSHDSASNTLTASIPNPLPPSHRALRQLARFDPPIVQTVPFPTTLPGSAVLRVHRANVVSYTKDIYNGARAYPYPVPLTLGTSALARVVSVGPDATKLQVGDLCLLDITIRSRDQERDVFLSAIHEGFTDGSRKLMSQGGFRDGTYAEFVRWPLECCVRVDETLLLGPASGFGYQLDSLLYISKLIVPYGGLGPGCCDLKPGETVVIAPATGGFGAAAVHVALELGAGRVIAMGRNTEVLEKVKNGEPSDKRNRVVTVPLTGEWEKDLHSLSNAKGGANRDIDVFFDISPPAAQDSGHIKAGVLSLRRGGRICLMGGVDEVTLPYTKIMHWNLSIRGKSMYTREDLRAFVSLVESGVVRLNSKINGWKMHGSECVNRYDLDDWEKAFDEAEKIAGSGNVLMVP